MDCDCAFPDQGLRLALLAGAGPPLTALRNLCVAEDNCSDVSLGLRAMPGLWQIALDNSAGCGAVAFAELAAAATELRQIELISCKVPEPTS